MPHWCCRFWIPWYVIPARITVRAAQCCSRLELQPNNWKQNVNKMTLTLTLTFDLGFESPDMSFRPGSRLVPPSAAHDSNSKQTTESKWGNKWDTVSKLISRSPDTSFLYLRQENSTGRVVPTFSVWYRTCLSGTGCPPLPFLHLRQ